MTHQDLPPLPRELTDRDEIGMSTMLGLSLPMLTVLLQCVAEAGGSTSSLELTAPSGARVLAVHLRDQDWFTVFTDHGEELSEPYADDRHKLLLDHGYRWENENYSQWFAFEHRRRLRSRRASDGRNVPARPRHPWKAPLAVLMDLRS